MLKGKALFNSIYTTVNKKKSKIILGDGDGADGHVLPYQEVVKVGPHVENIKEGDIILINIDKFQNKLPGVEINNNIFLAITERDVMYVYDKSEAPGKETIPS